MESWCVEMSRICIIHPEGNISNNPNLSGIVEILCKNNYKVDIYSSSRPGISQKSPCCGANFIIQDDLTNIRRNKNYVFKLLKNYDICIGVDKGIIEASYISRLANIPYGLISYEILFSDEIGLDNKKSEIEACKNISFAVVQDKKRASFLSSENKITNDKFIYIPTANKGTKKYRKMNYWHKKFGIPPENKIALYMGSVLGKWAMVRELLEIIPDLPKNWNIVIHNRYGFKNLVPSYRNIINESKNIHISEYSFENFSEMEEPLSSADIGFAFYKPIGGPNAGKNIKYIGLSSGKISTYLQYGIPVISNIGHPMRDYFKKYNIGIIIDKMEELKIVLSSWDTKKFSRENCINFFSKYLDLDKTIVPLLAKVSVLLNNSKVKQKRTIYKNIFMVIFRSIRIELKKLKNKIIKILKLIFFQ